MLYKQTSVRMSSMVSPVFINNSMETFTPTRSGAIATHIRECCRAAQLQKFEPVVISIRCEAETCQGCKNDPA